MTTTTTTRTTKTTSRRRTPAAEYQRADRERLATFARTISVSQSTLRRDACGDWILSGPAGHVSSDGASFYVYLAWASVRGWSNAKRRFAYLAVTQDGDEEGVFRIDRPLSPAQATDLRNALLLRKVTPLSQDRRKNLSTIGRRTKFARQKQGGLSA
ncbi:hypothetical protein [Bradyrhizobium sp. URHC0002]